MKYTVKSLETVPHQRLLEGEFEHEGILYTHALEVRGKGEPLTTEKVKHVAFQVGDYIIESRPKFPTSDELLVFNYEGLGILYVKPNDNEEDW